MQAQRIAQYTKRYRLAFTLLNENAASPHLVNSWDIQAAFAGKFSRFICVPTANWNTLQTTCFQLFPG
jgi:phosphatidylinositol glycan class S